MTRTLIGQVITDDGMARRTSWHQPEPEQIGPLCYRARPVELRTEHFTINRHAVRRTQPSWLGVTLDHGDDCVGHAEHLEQQHDGLWLVAEVHGDVPPELCFLSPEWTARRDGTDVELRGAALCSNPAQICMRPIILLAGRLNAVDTRGLPDRHAAMIQRARDSAAHRRYGERLVVHAADSDRLLDRHAPRFDERPAGPMRHSTPIAGSILSIR